MGYNRLSGSIIAPIYFGPGDGEVGNNILSGNLSTSDGASIINVPRVDNAVNNGIVTNVGGDSNTLTCESNLTFDGSVLTVTGELTASIGVSASFFEGDGSRLTGIVGGGSGGGIFTQIAANTAYSTSSIQVGSSDTPAHTLSIAGSSFLSGGLIYKRKFVTTNYSATLSDYYIGADTTSNILKVTLPVASTAVSGQTFVIKDEGGSAGTNNITISGSGSDTIDGQNTVVLESPHASIQLYCNGIDKYFIF